MISVKFFAILKETFVDDLIIEKEALTVSELRQILVSKKADLESILGRSRFVVNNVFVTQDYIFKANDTIYVVPPSSGG